MIIIHVRSSILHYTYKTDSIPISQVLSIIRVFWQDSCKAALTLEQNNTVTQSRTVFSLSNEFVTTPA